MSFAPVLPTGGYAGWRSLQRTMPAQLDTLARSAPNLRDAEYVRSRIGAADTASDLVNDRRLLRIVLTSFGLEADSGNRAFLERVLNSDPDQLRSLVNRLADKRYLEMARTLGFGSAAPPDRTTRDFADRLIAQFNERKFETAVGDQDPSMRMALALDRDLSVIAARDSTEASKWFAVLGTPSLRKVFESAFRLPSSFGALDIDRQVSILQRATERTFGSASISQFTDPDRREGLVRRFILAEQVARVSAASAGTTALALLEQSAAAMRALRGR
jgi:hypothetical protein